MALGFTQPLTEMSNRNLLGRGRGVKCGQRVKDDNLTIICDPVVWEKWDDLSQPPGPPRPFTAMISLFLFLFFTFRKNDGPNFTFEN
jgi:hypothetical protein